MSTHRNNETVPIRTDPLIEGVVPTHENLTCFETITEEELGYIPELNNEILEL